MTNTTAPTNSETKKQSNKTKAELEAEASERRLYLRRKAKAIEFEKTNYQYIFFMRGMNGFYVAGDHSAIILYNLIAPELGLKIAIRKDSDFERRFLDGKVAIRNVDKFIERLSDSKLLSLVVQQTKDSITFKLKHKLKKAEYELLVNSEEIKRAELMNMVSSAEALPKTYQALRQLAKTVYQKVSKKSDKVERELVTHQLMDDVRGILLTFLMGCRDARDFTKSMNEVRDNLTKMLRDLLIVEATGVWRIEECRQVAFLVTKTQMTLADERKKVE
ncbi:hypothetical protein J6S35_01025 [Candidatus Saccharibacteria bacterium]|nr:hypothetical protein [Candidatus Saccharibacteria bacterium]